MSVRAIAICVLLAFAAPAFALEMPLLFSDGAVLQRDRPLPVWGWARPGSNVQVVFGGSRADAKADGEGRWQVRLPPHAAGGPYTLTVTGDGETRRVRDVLVGDVWLASGQSNMEWPLARTDQGQAAAAAAHDGLIRHFKVPPSWADTPQTRLAGGQWIAASSRTAGEFSAVAYYFAKELRATQGVAIGIIDSTWGGSAIEAWMDVPMLGLDAESFAAHRRAKAEADARTEAATRATIAHWPQDAAADYSAADLDEHDWATVQVPAMWEQQGYPSMDGTAWYRRTFMLSAQEAAAGVTLGLGEIDDDDETWVNGQRVGGLTQAWDVARVYRVPAAVLHAGPNTIAVRVVDHAAGGGIGGEPAQLYVHSANGTVNSLAGAWKFRASNAVFAPSEGKHQTDTLVYNRMIRPLQPYALRGVIWYQGETNAVEAGAYRYRDRFKAMIEGWRDDWQAPRLPFLWAQLANYVSGDDRRDAAGVVVDSPWATLRESQSAALALPATAQAVTIDVGNPADIHPGDKRSVGHRLALAARHVAYDEPVVHSGPVFREARINGGRVVLQFDTQGRGLAVAGGGTRVQGFELAGTDRQWHMAQAELGDGGIVMHSDAVARPVALRYAWRDNPVDANLVNEDGLPASPFRTREW